LKKPQYIDYSSLNVFSVFNQTDIKYPIVLSVPHSGQTFPPAFFEMTNLSLQDLRANEDLYVDDLLSPLLNNSMTGIVMHMARAFIDINRDQIELDDHMFEDYPSDKIIFENSRCRSGYGLIHRIAGDSRPIYKKPLLYTEVQERIKNVYLNYHKNLKKLVDASVKKFGFCLVLDCHSMPSKICSIVDENSKIDICLGDLFLQSCPTEISDILKNSLIQKGYSVLKNIPYSGAYTTFHYCEPRQKIYTLQLEVNRALYADEKTFEKKADYARLQKDLCESISELAKSL